MGDEITTNQFSAQDFSRYKNHLEQETALLNDWFADEHFATQGAVAGFELEVWLMDRQNRPAPLNEKFLALFANPLASPELASFNIEVNSTPRPLRDRVFSEMHAELTQTWARCCVTAEQLDANIAMIGILPTVQNEDLSLANMSQLRRYRALNREVLRMRKGKPIVFEINGVEHLKVTHRDVMLEAAATSFQIHLQVDPVEAVRLMNASIILSAPMVALTANSPYLFGKDLWDETRIPLFEQAVAVGGFNGAAFGPIRRVTFGSGYVRNSLMECFQENLDHYPILLPVELAGGPQQMRYLRLHNGTIWRWNRPLIGFDNKGEPHLRIEHRVIPAGPSVIDAIANAAFFYGAVAALGYQDMPPELTLDFGKARDNFYTAARLGLRASVTWLDGRQVVIKKLLQDELLPMARQGLEKLGVSQNDIDTYLGIIGDRLQTGQNGAQWQRAYVKEHGRDMNALTAAYLQRQESGEPVHAWGVKKGHIVADRKGNASTMLNIYHDLPDGLLQQPANQLYKVLPGPSLIHLSGRHERPLFVSVLLHGNEVAGWEAVRALLQKYAGQTLPRAMSIFIGNVQAARHGLRCMPDHIDYNRIWRGDTPPSDQTPPEQVLVHAVLKEVQKCRPFASVDIHNNTGRNPHYACVNKLESPFFHLATLFSRTVVYFLRPNTVFSMAMAAYCPSVTVECGKPEEPRGVMHALQYLEACLHLTEFPAHEVAAHDIDLFHTVATVKVSKGYSVGFEGDDADICLVSEIDQFNFQELPAGTLLGKVKNSDTPCLRALNEQGDEVGGQYFHINGNEIRTTTPVMPSMLTLDRDIIRQDCVCYLMERLDFANSLRGGD